MLLLMAGVAHCAEPVKSLGDVITGIRARFPEVQQWTTEQAAHALSGNDDAAPVLLDIRTRAEYDVSHLPGAIQVDPDTKPEVVLENIPVNRRILVYCSVGYRSSAMARRIMMRGRVEVANIEGSIFAWANEGRPLKSTNGPADKVHGYNKVWSRYVRPELVVLP